uniref:Uncharacterized protein n=1 Tax=Mesocestoides corti TaxID=53468 RepID=A0A5K3FXU2_MESCO
MKKRGITASSVDQSQGRSVGQAPSIQVHQGGCGTHVFLLLIPPCLWLSTNLHRRPFELKMTDVWLSSAWFNVSASL